jgi:hypothetical protein
MKRPDLWIQLSSPNDGVALAQGLGAPLAIVTLAKKVDAAPRSTADEVRPVIQRDDIVRFPTVRTDGFAAGVFS